MQKLRTSEPESKLYFEKNQKMEKCSHSSPSLFVPIMCSQGDVGGFPPPPAAATAQPPNARNGNCLAGLAVQWDSVGIPFLPAMESAGKLEAGQYKKGGRI